MVGGHPGSRSGITQAHPEKALAFLARLATELTVVLSITELVDRTLNLLSEEAEFDSCTVGLIDEPPKETITLVGAAGIRTGYKGLVIPRGRSLNWTVAESRQPLYVPDMWADPRVYKRQAGIRSGIYAPLIIRGRVIGVLSAHRNVVNAFGPEDLDVLTVVARYLAGAFEVARLYEQVFELATTDPMTGLSNRRAILERFEAEVSRPRRSDETGSVAILDLDDLKGINDTLGHRAGDAVLVQVAEALTREIRAQGIPGRLAGDEFLLILLNTGRDAADATLRRLSRIEATVPGTPREIAVTLSWGLATWPDDGDTAQALLTVADSRLYLMKKECAARRERLFGPPGRPDLVSGSLADDRPC